MYKTYLGDNGLHHETDLVVEHGCGGGLSVLIAYVTGFHQVLGCDVDLRCVRANLSHYSQLVKSESVWGGEDLRRLLPPPEVHSTLYEHRCPVEIGVNATR